jgi:hypothetical protein
MSTPDERRMHYFELLTLDERIATIQRLASSGMTVHTIAAATGITVEQIRLIVGAAGSGTSG